LRVMKTQNFKIRQPKPSGLYAGQNLREGRDVTPREDVLLYPAACHRRAQHPTDRMDHREAIHGEKARNDVEKIRIIWHANMLEHADRDYAIELPLDVAIIEKLKGDAIG
jgi:hypothetical protein